MNEWIITTAITLGIGVITYFLKRTMNQVDNQGAKIQEMFNQMQTKAEQKEQTVKLLVKNSLAGVIIDRFGKNVMLIPTDDEHFTVNVDVHVSRQFLGWVFSLGEDIKIVGPDEVVDEMKKEINRIINQYKYDS